MPRRVNELGARALHDEAQHVLDLAPLALVKSWQGRKHRQPGGVAGSPTGRAQYIGLEVEFRAVGRLPLTAVEQGQPRFPDESRAGLNDDRVPVAAHGVDVLLPLLKCQIACSRRPAFNRQVRRNRIRTGIRLVPIKRETDRHERLRIRDERKVHFLEGPECAPGGQKIAADLRDHGVGVGQRRPAGDVLVPRVVHGEDLHCRDDRVGFRNVEQDRVGKHRRRAEEAPGVVDAFCLRRQDSAAPQQDKKGLQTVHASRRGEPQVHCQGTPTGRSVTLPDRSFELFV